MVVLIAQLVYHLDVESKKFKPGAEAGDESLFGF